MKRKVKRKTAKKTEAPKEEKKWYNLPAPKEKSIITRKEMLLDALILLGLILAVIITVIIPLMNEQPTTDAKPSYTQINTDNTKVEKGEPLTKGERFDYDEKGDAHFKRAD